MMRYEIWQAPLSCPYKFLHYEWINDVKPTIRDYVMTYAGKTEANATTTDTLENLWTKFNVDPPEDFHGMSLSVSDVICLICNGNERTWWYVDGIGYKRLDWRK